MHPRPSRAPTALAEEDTQLLADTVHQTRGAGGVEISSHFLPAWTLFPTLNLLSVTCVCDPALQGGAVLRLHREASAHHGSDFPARRSRRARWASRQRGHRRARPVRNLGVLSTLNTHSAATSTGLPRLSPQLATSCTPPPATWMCLPPHLLPGMADTSLVPPCLSPLLPPLRVFRRPAAPQPFLRAPSSTRT